MGDATPERWLPLGGFDGLFEKFYEISSIGRSRSLRTGKILKPGLAQGYPMILPQVNGARRKVYIHRAVAAAFIGPCPEGQQVRHKDGERTHCEVSNLEYGTPSENMYDTVRYGGNYWANRTHCDHGHEFTPENTCVLTRRDGRFLQRVCRTCRNDRVRAWKAAHPDELRTQRRDYKQRLKRRRAA